MGNMETKQTKWEELSISNDFLFGKVMQNPKLCKELLQRILPDLNIDRIEYPELQKSINMDMDARSVRLDVYVKDEKEVVYDIEMQVSHTKELAKRSRYYHYRGCKFFCVYEGKILPIRFRYVPYSVELLD